MREISFNGRFMQPISSDKWRAVLFQFPHSPDWQSLDSSSQTKNQKSRNITTFEERPNTSERNRHCDSVHGCFGGRDPSDIYLWWILWFRVYKREKLSLLCLRRKTTREKAKKGEGYFVSRVESINLTWLDFLGMLLIIHFRVSIELVPPSKFIASNSY